MSILLVLANGVAVKPLTDFKTYVVNGAYTLGCEGVTYKGKLVFFTKDSVVARIRRTYRASFERRG